MAVAKKTVEIEATLQDAAATATAPLKAVQEQVRVLTETSLERAKEQYSTVKKAAEQATGRLETSFEAFTKGLVAFNTQAIEALRANTNAHFDHIAKLQTVTSFAEAIELNTAHARNQIDAAIAQGKQLQSVARKAANDVAAPVQAGFSAK
jgi:phasin